MTDRQSIRRLLVVNGVTACLLMIGLALKSLFLPVVCFVLLSFSTFVAATWFDRNRA